MRRQEDTLKQAIKSHKKEFPYAKELLRIETHPNSVILLNNIKEELKDNIEFCRNYLSLINIDEETFLKRIQKIDKMKKEVSI